MKQGPGAVVAGVAHRDGGGDGGGRRYKGRTGNFDSVGERGLLGIPFDPDYATNRYVYVYYTRHVGSGVLRNRVSRFTANVSGDQAVDGSEVVIMELDNLSGATNHNGGAIHFGPGVAGMRRPAAPVAPGAPPAPPAPTI